MAKGKNNRLFMVGQPAVSVNLETGEETPIEGSGFRLLPGPPGSCEWCHTKHEPELPHNRDSLAYQMKFQQLHGRPPTWEDAMAHCTPEVKGLWLESAKQVYAKLGRPLPDDLV